MKKFTEEQYQDIVEQWEKDELYVRSLQNVIDLMPKFGMNDGELTLLALALANEQTREWAHDQFVEKEKNYIWRLKSNPEFVISKSDGDFYLDADPFEKTDFTETEIKNSPFKPEWFDKEEVE